MHETVTIRPALPSDGAEIGRIFTESWRETYPGLLPDHVLTGLVPSEIGRRWAAFLTDGKARARTLVAQDGDGAGLCGYAVWGGARDRSLGFDAEVYELYLDPMHQGRGLGRALLAGCFRAISQAGGRSAVIWALEGNPARWFYERHGGVLAAERRSQRWGAERAEVAYGWRTLSLAKAPRGRNEPIPRGSPSTGAA